MGLVSITQLANGTTADATAVDANFNNIANVLNGNIDATNLAGGTIGASAYADGWTPLIGITPSSVTYNGNRSYNLVFNGVNLTSQISNGMRLKGTRTVTAPTQSTSLNGTTQYYSKTSPAGMTFTNNFVVSGWVKLSSYVQSCIASRFDGTSGWAFYINASGQVCLQGWNGGSANWKLVNSYQSIPLNKWVHVTAQLDMTATTNSPTVNYVMIDGVDVPAVQTTGGTNPTALVQAGNLLIGALNSTTPSSWFNGKIAQVAIFSAKVTEATIQSYISQGLAGTETSLISAYSFNNSINDLNANANNLTANGSVVATNADSPFAQDDTGTPLGTTDYGIVTSKVFSTNTTLTVQVPEGCAIPTTGGVSAVSYSTQKVPYGFPTSRTRWRVYSLYLTALDAGTASPFWAKAQLTVPIGTWTLGYQGALRQAGAGAAANCAFDLNTNAIGSPSVPTISTLRVNIYNAPAGPTSYDVIQPTSIFDMVSLAAQTVYNLFANSGIAYTNMGVRGDFTPFEVIAELATL